MYIWNGSAPRAHSQVVCLHSEPSAGSQVKLGFSAVRRYARQQLTSVFQVQVLKQVAIRGAVTNLCLRARTQVAAGLVSRHLALPRLCVSPPCGESSCLCAAPDLNV
jgi:uncharacterized protein (DUF2132 family)